jgi:hypothetical protein
VFQPPSAALAPASLRTGDHFLAVACAYFSAGFGFVSTERLTPLLPRAPPERG